MDQFFKVHILIAFPWSGRVLLWWGMGRWVVKPEIESSWVTSPFSSRRLNNREMRVGWYDRKEPWALESESRGSTLSLITTGCVKLGKVSKPWSHHCTVMTTPSCSGHCWQIPGGLGNMSSHGSTHTGLALPVVAHSENYLSTSLPPLQDEETSKRSQNILIEPQRA